MFLFQPDFSAIVRTLTGLGGAIGLTQTVNSTIAANASFGFGPAANIVSIFTFASTADASGTVLIQFTDNTNTWLVATIAAGATGGQDISVSNNLVLWQLHNNSATVAAKVWASGYSWVR